MATHSFMKPEMSPTRLLVEWKWAFVIGGLAAVAWPKPESRLSGPQHYRVEAAEEELHLLARAEPAAVRPVEG
jgi:hypothetical protein